MKQIVSLLFLLSCTAVYAQQQDSVNICGRVTESHRPDRRREGSRTDEARNKVEPEDMENSDRGEGFYYMEKENYIQ